MQTLQTHMLKNEAQTLRRPNVVWRRSDVVPRQPTSVWRPAEISRMRADIVSPRTLTAEMATVQNGN